MFFYLLLALFLLIISCIIYLVFLVQYYHIFFKRQGIATLPLSSYLYGHFTILWNAERFSEQLCQWTKQYGSIYGLVAGTRPVYIVSDVSFLQEVFITQFSKFQSRHVPLLTHILGQDRLHVFASSGDQWRRHRRILISAFSSVKLQKMSSKIDECVKTFVHLSKNGDINIFPRLKQFTLDVICRCAFDVETEVQGNSSNIWLQKVMEIFVRDFDRTPLAMLNRFLPGFGRFWAFLFHIFRTIGLITTPANLWIIENAKDLVNERLLQYQKHQNDDNCKDVLQLLIKAAAADPEKAQLSLKELLSHVFVIMVSGFDSPSTVLAYCLHTLANRIDLQEKLYKEILINSHSNENTVDDLSKHDLSKYIYLDAFINEVLRMNPTAVQFVNRQCTQDTEVQGYKIPKGSLVQADVYTIHYDSTLWGPLPTDEFHLERHMTKRHPLALLAFGAGPRQCLGLRFAFGRLEVIH
ncbi:unnamed protein product [Adineta steineri]|uniref:Cytochrome P450 n=1 Tax=Adineta steineri TaxID=433720 RepID=A0A814THA5_9BILA|nr:unnamed protein product [Adineta steineri]CAF3849340.1 unnamed protein product [Adineta steineri]